MVVETEDLEQLAESCLESAKALKQYLSSKGYAQPTFDQNGPESYPPLPPHIEIEQLKLIEASSKLRDLAAPPEDAVSFHPYIIMQDLNALRYVSAYRIASHIPLNKAISYPDLAEQAGVNVTQLRQVIRHCCSLHVFTEVDGKNGSGKHIAHTIASKSLLGPAGCWIDFVTLDVLPWSEAQLRGHQRWGHGSQEPNQTSFNAATNSEQPLFRYFETSAVQRERFSALMSYCAGMPALSREHISSGFDWKSLGRDAKVVDIAGNYGQSSVDIAKANPALTIVVQDLPNIVAQARAQKAHNIPGPLQANFSFEVHDMFEPQSITDADVYFYRMIFHDYSDKYAIKLLKALIPGMQKPGARLVICDIVLPPVGGAPAYLERFIRAQDMQMGMVLNALERDEQQWIELFAAADPRFKIRNIVMPQGSVMSMIEVVLEE
ncbi:hypothetical protein DV736_g6630, partial [Chaetothyriales sp. CBS 134916]